MLQSTNSIVSEQSGAPPDARMHTPGPWHIEPAPGRNSMQSIRAADGVAIAFVNRRPNAAANAQAIATLPDILTALKRLVQLGEDDGSEPTYAWKDAFAEAAAVIGEAEGREP